MGRDGSYGFGGETKGGVSRRQIGRKGGLGLEGNGREWEGIIGILLNPTRDLVSFFVIKPPPPPPNRNNFHISKKAKCMNSVFIGIDMKVGLKIGLLCLLPLNKGTSIETICYCKFKV